MTDRTYADVSMRVTFAAGQAPFVVLRDDQGAAHVVDDGCCSACSRRAGPRRCSTSSARRDRDLLPSTARPRRPATPGSNASARVSLGVRGALPTTPSIVSEIVVKRLGVP